MLPCRQHVIGKVGLDLEHFFSPRAVFHRRAASYHVIDPLRGALKMRIRVANVAQRGEDGLEMASAICTISTTHSEPVTY